MATRQTHDTITLTKVPAKDIDSLLILDRHAQKPQIGPVNPSGIAERLSSFIPKLAAANKSLTEDSGNKLDVDVQKVAVELEESDASSEGDTSDEIDTDAEVESRVEFDLTLFRAKQPTIGGLEILQDVEALPEGFREDSETCSDDSTVRKTKKLIQEL